MASTGCFLPRATASQKARVDLVDVPLEIETLVGFQAARGRHHVGSRSPLHDLHAESEPSHEPQLRRSERR